LWSLGVGFRIFFPADFLRIPLFLCSLSVMPESFRFHFFAGFVRGSTPFITANRTSLLATAVLLLLLNLSSRADATELERASASSSQPGYAPAGAIDHDRFSFASNHAWKGEGLGSNWFWEIQFSKPRDLGAILQIQGDHEFVFQNA